MKTIDTKAKVYGEYIQTRDFDKLVERLGLKDALVTIVEEQKNVTFVIINDMEPIKVMILK